MRLSCRLVAFSWPGSGGVSARRGRDGRFFRAVGARRTVAPRHVWPRSCRAPGTGYAAPVPLRGPLDDVGPGPQGSDRVPLVIWWGPLCAAVLEPRALEAFRASPGGAPGPPCFGENAVRHGGVAGLLPATSTGE